MRSIDTIYNIQEIGVILFLSFEFLFIVYLFYSFYRQYHLRVLFYSLELQYEKGYISLEDYDEIILLQRQYDDKHCKENYMKYEQKMKEVLKQL